MWKRCVFAYNYISSQYSAFSAAKPVCKAKAEQNQVCEVRLIPRLNLFHFWEYEPFSTHEKIKLQNALWEGTSIFSGNTLAQVNVNKVSANPDVCVGNIAFDTPASECNAYLE